VPDGLGRGCGGEAERAGAGVVPVVRRGAARGGAGELWDGVVDVPQIRGRGGAGGLLGEVPVAVALPGGRGRADLGGGGAVTQVVGPGRGSVGEDVAVGVVGQRDRGGGADLAAAELVGVVVGVGRGGAGAVLPGGSVAVGVVGPPLRCGGRGGAGGEDDVADALEAVVGVVEERAGLRPGAAGDRDLGGVVRDVAFDGLGDPVGGAALGDQGGEVAGLVPGLGLGGAVGVGGLELVPGLVVAEAGRGGADDDLGGSGGEVVGPGFDGGVGSGGGGDGAVVVVGVSPGRGAASDRAEAPVGVVAAGLGAGGVGHRGAS